MPLPRRCLAVAALLLLTACGGGGTTSSGGGSSSAGGSSAGERPAGSADTGGAAAGTSSSLARVAVADAEVVRTAELAVRVGDVRRAADRAASTARDAGGTVASERADGAGDGREAELVLRVPPDRFDAVLDAVGALGAERRRTVSAEQVGDQLVDLEARLQAQRASVDRVRGLLAEARDLSQVVQVEGELTRRTADLESLEGRLAALRDRVDLATITVRLDAAPRADAVPGFLSGLSGGWTALLGLGRLVALCAGALLPFVPLALVVGVVVVRLRRRRTPAAPQPAG